MLVGADDRTDAVVLSGGGAKGAYEIGVLQALFAGASPATGFRPLEVEVYTGTSVGAYNASFLVAQGTLPSLAAVDALARIWRQVFANTPESCGNGVFRVRGAPLQLGDAGCLLHPLQELADLGRDALYFATYAVTRGSEFLRSDAPLLERALQTIDISAFVSPQPLYENTRRTIDLQALGASPRTLTVIASNWALATVRHFQKEEIAVSVGIPAILASAAIPGLFPPVLIDGVPFVDGGVLMNTPLKPAIADGAGVLHIIYLDPCLLDIPFPEYPDTLDTVYRLWAIQQAEAFRKDTATVAAINREIEAHERIDESGRLRRDLAALLPISRVLQRQAAGRPYRPLTVHNYRPSTDLGGALGLLDFRLDNIDKLIAMGYDETVNHDCREAGCVLPDHSPSDYRTAAAA